LVVDLEASPYTNEDGRSSVVSVGVLAARALANFEGAAVTWRYLGASVVQATVSGGSCSVATTSVVGAASGIALSEWDTVSWSGLHTS